MKRISLILLLFCLAACPGPKKTSSEILVGVYGSLTGTTATFGQSTRKGVELAAEEINNAGGLLGKKIRLIVEDTQGKPEEAQTVVTKLVSRDRVIAVIGETASSRSLAAAPVCQANRIPMITPSSTNARVTQVGDYIFRVCFIDAFQGQVMARFVAQSLKLKNVAILRDIKNDYSVGLAAVFIESFKKMGGNILADESYSEGDTDFSAQLTALRSANPEAIFVPGYYTEAGLVARQARNLGITVPLLGGDGWESPKLLEIGGAALNNSYYSNHYSVDDPSPAIQNFVKTYKAKFGESPDAVAALSYDAMKLVADAIVRTGGVESAKMRDALASTKNFPAVTGDVTMDAERNPIKPAVVLKIQDGKIGFVERIQP